VLEIGKQTLKDELKFNEGAEFSKIYERYPDFVRTEPLPPTNSVFDVEDSELDTIWDKLETYREPKKIWEVRFSYPPPILFGVGAIQRLGERAKRLGIKKAFLLAGPVQKKLGRADEVQKILERIGVNSVLFSEKEADPPVEEIEKGTQFYREHSCDGLVALGGGSSMDAAKAIGLMVSHPGTVREYDSSLGGGARITSSTPTLICIPTTSGTGSETNGVAVITDKRRVAKFAIMSDLLLPKLAIVDPDLCKSMPADLTAATGVDALAHCIEGYVSETISYQPFYEALALYGVKLIGRSLRKAYNDGEDIEARMDMCMAAIHGGITLSKGLGIGHALGHTLGAHYHLSHGNALAVSLLCFVRANKRACREQFLDLAWAMDRSKDLETALVKLYKDVNLPTRLSEYGIPEDDLRKIAFDTSKDVGNLVGNPTPVGESQILKLLKEVY
jgi:alcohol dehydrogenase class IV